MSFLKHMYKEEFLQHVYISKGTYKRQSTLHNITSLKSKS